MPDAQFGFRYKHSTVHAITKFVSNICWSLNEKKFFGTCLIDLEKAFDSVWLDGLIYKLIKNSFPIHLIKIKHNRKFKVYNGKENSDLTFELLAGLQQGAVNSLILFNIYIYIKFGGYK